MFATTASRNRQLQAGVRRAADVRARVAHDARRGSTQFADNTEPARHAAAAGRARALARRCTELAGARAGPEGAVPRPRPADHAPRKTGFPAAQQHPRRPAPAARADRPGVPPADPDPPVPRLLQERAHRVLRQHGAATQARRARHARALPAHDEPAQPREPRRLSAAHRHQPPEPLPAAGRLQPAREAPAGLREPRLRPHRPGRSPRRRRPSRACRSRPRSPPDVSGITPALLDQINQFVYPANGDGSGAALRAAGQVQHSGETTRYPHVKARARLSSGSGEGVPGTCRAGRREAPRPRARRRSRWSPGSRRVLALRLRAERGESRRSSARARDSYRATQVLPPAVRRRRDRACSSAAPSPASC